MNKFLSVLGAFGCSAITACAHDTADNHSHDDAPAVRPWPVKAEKKGPVKAPEPLQVKVPVSGQGFWKFMAVTNAVPVPPAAQPSLVKAHGTLIFDAARDTVYFGARQAGWIAFSNQLRDSWIVAGDAAFKSNNMHGADILPRKGKAPLVAAADDEGGKVYLTDTTFLNPQLLGRPTGGGYTNSKAPFRPTDVAFADADHLYVTDGYGSANFMPATTHPLAYEGDFFGGKQFSKTPHGITFDPREKTMLVSARPEGQLKHWSDRKKQVLSIDALPPGTLLCDVDVWGDYALAACLDAPNKTPGPLIIVNLKTRTVVSTIKPKEELGYEFASHMHDACWYVYKEGRKTDVYLVFTAWNPGGVGALKLVNVPD